MINQEVNKMSQCLNAAKTAIHSFSQDEQGAQVVEYALIIAVVSIALVVALKALTASGGGFASFIPPLTTSPPGAPCALSRAAAAPRRRCPPRFGRRAQIVFPFFIQPPC